MPAFCIMAYRQLGLEYFSSSIFLSSAAAAMIRAESRLVYWQFIMQGQQLSLSCLLGGRPRILRLYGSRLHNCGNWGAHGRKQATERPGKQKIREGPQPAVHFLDRKNCSGRMPAKQRDYNNHIQDAMAIMFPFSTSCSDIKSFAGVKIRLSLSLER